jgi:hypothetical protein
MGGVGGLNGFVGLSGFLLHVEWDVGVKNEREEEGEKENHRAVCGVSVVTMN